MNIVYSVDIETDGVVAGRNNMLSLGAAALDMDTGLIEYSFKRNLSLVPNLMPDPDTMSWWKQFPDAYRAARINATLPSAAMKAFVAWVEATKTENSVMFAWNPVMDLGFVKYYIHAFHPDGEELVINGFFGKRCMGLDLKTLTALALKQKYRGTKMDTLPNSVRLDENGEVIDKHDHDALNDAVEQAHIFYNVTQRLGFEV